MAQQLRSAVKHKSRMHPMEVWNSGFRTWGLLDEICLDDVKATPIEDPRLALETFLSSNLSGEYC